MTDTTKPHPAPHPADDPAMRAAVFAGAAADPAWLGYWLERRRRRTGAGREAVAADLKTDLRGLAMLALCRTPTEENFADDLEAVCRRTGADPAALARLLQAERQGDDPWGAPSG
jgi:hypothetical protein